MDEQVVRYLERLRYNVYFGKKVQAHHLLIEARRMGFKKEVMILAEMAGIYLEPDANGDEEFPKDRITVKMN